MAAIRHSLLLAVLLLFIYNLQVSTAQSPSVPIMEPPFEWDPEMNRLLAQSTTPTPSSSTSDWSSLRMPRGCKFIATEYGLNPADFEVFNVTYNDCEEPWTFCRHKNAPAKRLDMIDVRKIPSAQPPSDELLLNNANALQQFSRVPVHMRQYVQHFIATPPIYSGCAFTYPWSWSDRLVVTEGCLAPNVLLHEVSHVLDVIPIQRGAPNPDAGFSSTGAWQEAVRADGVVPTGYADSDWVESFAEVGVLAAFDGMVPGGLQGLRQDWTKVHAQVNTYRSAMGVGFASPGALCDLSLKLPSTLAVPVTASARIAPRIRIGRSRFVGRQQERDGRRGPLIYSAHGYNGSSSVHVR